MPRMEKEFLNVKQFLKWENKLPGTPWLWRTTYRYVDLKIDVAWPDSPLLGQLPSENVINSNSFDSLSEFDPIQVDMTLPAAVEFFTSRCDTCFIKIRGTYLNINILIFKDLPLILYDFQIGFGSRGKFHKRSIAQQLSLNLRSASSQYQYFEIHAMNILSCPQYLASSQSLAEGLVVY